MKYDCLTHGALDANLANGCPVCVSEMRSRINLLESHVARMVTAARRVLSDIDDDGVAERNDMGVLALRKAVEGSPSEEIWHVIACARRVHGKFGPENDWSEWRDLGDALSELDNLALA